MVLAGRRTELTRWFRLDRSGSKENKLILVPDLYLALKLIQSKESKAQGERDAEALAE